MSIGIGVDIGGTKIAAGLVSEDGELLHSTTVPTPRGSTEIVEAAARAVEELQALSDAPARAVGVGAAGFVGADRSTITFAPNIDWRDEPFGAALSARLDLPVVVENDANVAAWAEFRFGAGRDASDILLVTLGTGVGGGVVQRGDLVRGGFGAAAEIGHLRVVRDGRQCGCGQRGCLEQYASGTALVRDARARLQAGDETGGALLAAAGGQVEGVSGPMITDLARGGDPLCVDLLHDLGTWLGEGCASLAAVLDPSLIVIGGGVADAGDLLLESVAQTFEEYLPGRSHRHVAEITLATLGNDAGLIGAADLGRFEESAGQPRTESLRES